MKRLIIVAAVAALAGCSQSETAPAPEPAAEATEAAVAQPLAADGKPSVGMYKVTTSEGEVFTEDVKADGTYVQTDKDGKVIETGKWVQKSPTEYCTTKDEAGAVEKCNVEGIDAAGVWTSKGPDGKTATVERVES
jgi:hypothetical protein